jgi:hypothetical protein
MDTREQCLSKTITTRYREKEKNHRQLSRISPISDMYRKCIS